MINVKIPNDLLRNSTVEIRIILHLGKEKPKINKLESSV